MHALEPMTSLLSFRGSATTLIFATLTSASMLGACGTIPDTAPREVSFPAADGGTLFADIHPGADGPAAPVVLLFHQGGGDARGEYGPIIPRLTARGLNVMAVDLGGGGDRFGVMNRTVASRPAAEPAYCDEYVDLQAALAFAVSSGFTGPQIVWGSSYSASLAIRLAVEHPERAAAVLAFSPAGGGPMEACKPDPYLPRLTVPLLALRPTQELALPSVARQNALITEAGHAVFEAVGGTHGSSMLVADRSDGDVEPTWERVLSFIDAALARRPTPGR